MTGASGRRGGGLGQALPVPEFRALWTAELVSVVGDQLARVGLSVLVFTRTGSAGWAAATYALTFLPALVGGVLLGRVADRYPRRRAGRPAHLRLPVDGGGLPAPVGARR